MAAGIPSVQNMIQRWAGASQNVIQAVENASTRTGVSFDYLMSKARQESSFDPNAKAGTSSATGLFQFIESTWLNAVRSYGDQFGLGHLSSQISVDKSGRSVVTDADTRQKILDLRKDPEVAANMTAAMTKDNASYLQNSLGGKVGENELYLAHFMGLGGADKFLKARQSNPYQSAADLFPAAAAANKNVFYDASGRKRNVDEVYNFFAKKMNPIGEKGGEQPVVTVVAAGPKTSDGSHFLPSMLRPSGQGFTVPVDVGQIEADLNAQWGQRQMLETMLSGMSTFGFKNEKESHSNLGNLISPYTSYVLAKMQTPDEMSKLDENHNKV